MRHTRINNDPERLWADAVREEGERHGIWRNASILIFNFLLRQRQQRSDCLIKSIAFGLSKLIDELEAIL